MWSSCACDSATTSTDWKERPHRYGATTSSPISSCPRVWPPNAGIPPPSIRRRLPSGKTTRMLSPWPTSMVVISNWPGRTSAGKGCASSNARAAATAIPLAMRQGRPRAKAAAIRAAASATPSQTGGVGTRQFGSIAACQLTTRWDRSSSIPTNPATQCQPVKMATNPAGTTTPISGTTTAFAERPETPRRWKYTTIGSARPSCTIADTATTSYRNKRSRAGTVIARLGTRRVRASSLSSIRN